MNQTKVAGIVTFIGALLFGIATGFHPIVVNPWPDKGSLHYVADSSNWMWDHFLMVAAVCGWLIGLATLSYPKQKLPVAYLFGAALAMWLLILANELTFLPYLVDQLAESAHFALRFIGELTFAFGLMGGYFAMMCIWLGVVFIGHQLRQETCSQWVGASGMISGVIGIFGIIYVFIYHDGFSSILILGLTSGLPYLWTMLYSAMMIKNS